MTQKLSFFKKVVALSAFVGLLGIGFSNPSVAMAANKCAYDSTQVKVQKLDQKQWSNTLNLSCGESFRVGGFRDNLSTFAGDDLALTLVKPGEIEKHKVNSGDIIKAHTNGYYRIYGKTDGYPGFNNACKDNAVVKVTGCGVIPQKPTKPVSPTPTNPTDPTGHPIKPWQPSPNTQACTYGSTQARVQKDINDPWKESLNIRWGETFNVGSFHDHTGQFANDTKLEVRGQINFWGYTKEISKVAKNGESMRPPLPGHYTLVVTTNGCSGPNFEQTVPVKVQGGWSGWGGWSVTN